VEPRTRFELVTLAFPGFFVAYQGNALGWRGPSTRLSHRGVVFGAGWLRVILVTGGSRLWTVLVGEGFVLGLHGWSRDLLGGV
jgi:hypothetical protein